MNPTPAKPGKPYDAFPLFGHANGQWAKKIKGRLYYFGPWADWAAALAEYERQAPYLHTGRTPPTTTDTTGPTVADATEAFLRRKRQAVDAGELERRTVEDYRLTAGRLVEYFGGATALASLRPEDFAAYRGELSKARGPTALGNEIQRVRTILKAAGFSGFGPHFVKPPKRIMRATRNAAGSRMWEADEIQTLLAAAGVQLRAMILLGIQAGFEPEDCRLFPVDVSRRAAAAGDSPLWVDYPRPKTHIRRRFCLWPETVAALAAAYAARPEPRDAAARDLAFVTKYGRPWGDNFNHRPISQEFRKLALACDLYRPRVAFLGLRHAFETIGGDTQDQVAVDCIMGHADHSMAGVYRERVADARLLAVTNAVRTWLYADADASPVVLPFAASAR